jgi:hypothetical protein
MISDRKISSLLSTTIKNQREHLLTTQQSIRRAKRSDNPLMTIQIYIDCKKLLTSRRLPSQASIIERVNAQPNRTGKTSSIEPLTSKSIKKC